MTDCEIISSPRTSSKCLIKGILDPSQAPASKEVKSNGARFAYLVSNTEAISLSTSPARARPSRNHRKCVRGLCSALVKHVCNTCFRALLEYCEVNPR